MLKEFIKMCLVYSCQLATSRWISKKYLTVVITRSLFQFSIYKSNIPCKFKIKFFFENAVPKLKLLKHFTQKYKKFYRAKLHTLVAP